MSNVLKENACIKCGNNLFFLLYLTHFLLLRSHCFGIFTNQRAKTALDPTIFGLFVHEVNVSVLLGCVSKQSAVAVDYVVSNFVSH